MVTANQLVCHLIGDYIIQSDWMAQEKTKESWPAFVHAVTYAMPFFFLTQSWKALAVIVGTHFVIDHWRLARYVCWVKNFFAPFYRYEIAKKTRWNPRFRECSKTGYSPDRPEWMTVWLMIVADNTMHIILNGIALRYL